MANAKIGAQASWNQNCVETITEGKTLVPGDSGKVFMIDNTTAHTITLQKLSSKIAGWNCKMIVQVDGSQDVSVVGYGLPAAGGGAGYDDANLVNYREWPMVDEAGAVVADADGFTIEAASVIGDSWEIFSDGTSWFVKGALGAVAAGTAIAS